MLLKGRDDNAAIAAIIAFCEQWKASRALSAVAAAAVDAIGNHCITCFQHAFDLAKVERERPVIDLESVYNVTGVLQ